ncbi:MAG: insulinase family protein [Alistipes sp.]|jgi:predicted Zn-dependent peptidase|nr:insulinase family protein [Alistipes sp.]
MKKTSLIFGMIAVLALAISSACGSTYKYETVKGDPMGSRIYTLDNGLKVYLAVNKETPRIQTNIAVRVGSKNDPAETTGLAHYFEHLMFKGTPNFGTQNYEAEKPLLDKIEALFETYRTTTDEAERAEIYKQIDQLSYEASGYSIPNEYDKLMAAIGATGTNAGTSYDLTVYIEDIPSNQIENWLKIEADRFKNPVIRGFHTELETVYEEKNMSLTQDSRKVMEAMLTDLFPTHPYGTQTVIGTQEHLKNPSITNIKNYHAQWYVPNNMAVCMSGDFDFDTTIALIDKYFGDMLPNPELPATVAEPLPAITAPVVSEVLGLDAENVSVAWRTGGAASTDNDMMSLIGSILYNGQAGLFDLDLMQQQKVLSAHAYTMPLADHGVLMLQGRPKAGQTLDEVKDLMMAEIEKLKAGDFDEKLLAATINNYKLGQMNYLDSNYGRADAFVSAFINNIPWDRAVGEIDRIAAITKADVVAFANANFTADNCAVIYKRQGKDPNELTIEKPQLTPIQTNRDATSAMVTEIQNSSVTPIEPVFVDFEKDMDRLTGKSGIEVLYKKNETTDLFQIIYLYEVGSNNDPAIGYAGQYLDYLGTPTMSAQQRAAELYDLACSFGISTNEDRTYLVITGLSENMPRAMEIAADLMANAVADEMILGALKADWMKSRVDAKLNQARNFGALRTYTTRGPEFVDATTMSNDELTALTSEDLLGKFRVLAGQQHRIMYYGPATQEALLADIEAKHNVAAELAPVPAKVKYPFAMTPSNSVVLAEYDAAQIYYWQYGNRGETYDPANDAIESLYNSYFGGGMSSIVFQEMREARGLAYSAQATLGRPSRKNDPYVYIAFIATQNDKLKDAAMAFDDIINNMPESEAAFNIAKESLIESMRTDRTIKSYVLWSWVAAQDLGLDYDARSQVWDKIQTMTLEDVKAFQKQWVAGRTYTFGILGRSADLDMEYLRSLGPVKQVSQEEIFGY